MIGKIRKIIKNPKMLFVYLDRIKLCRMDDYDYIKILYEEFLGKKLNLINPEGYNEKLQWLKLYDRKSLYTDLADKINVKEYVAKRIGKQYIIPTIGIYNNFDELPNKFVMKCNHDSGGLVICKDKNKFNKRLAKKKIEKSLRNNYFYKSREWSYKNVNPRIIIEKYMADENDELIDYKFFVFNGKVKMMFVATDRNAETETCFDFYDENFRHLPFTNGHPNSNRKIEKPQCFEKMLYLAEVLGKNIPHVRVDFYNINGKIYFGEITFYHLGGLVRFEPEEWDKRIGNMLELPKEKLINER